MCGANYVEVVCGIHHGKRSTSRLLNPNALLPNSVERKQLVVLCCVHVLRVQRLAKRTSPLKHNKEGGLIEVTMSQSLGINQSEECVGMPL